MESYRYYSSDYEDPYNCVESYPTHDIRLVRKHHTFDGFEVLDHVPLKDVDSLPSEAKKFIDPSRKIIINNLVTYGHMMQTWLYVLVRSLELAHPLTILLYAKPDSPDLLVLHTKGVTEYLYEELTKRGHRVEFIGEEDFYVNNFIHVKTPFWIRMESAKPVSDFLRENLDPLIRESRPTEKIYLSRGKVTTRDGHQLSEIPQEAKTSHEELQSFREANKYGSNTRLDDEQALEKYLQTLGFTIVYPEDFSSYKKQLETIASAKIVMSVTSSALYSCLVMAPNTFVIELNTPLPTVYRNDGTPDPKFLEVQDQYRVQSTINNKLHMVISNKTQKVADIIETIESTEHLKAFLSS